MEEVNRNSKRDSRGEKKQNSKGFEQSVIFPLKFIKRFERSV